MSRRERASLARGQEMNGIFECLVGGWQAARIVGITYPRLDNWIRTGLLPAPERPAQGKGSRRGFSLRDLVRARVVARLRESGVSLQMIRRILAELGKRWRIEDPLLQGRLALVGDDLFWELDEDTLLDVLTGQTAARRVLVIDLGQEAQEVYESMEAVCAA